MNHDASDLSEIVGYRFKDSRYLEMALRHRSAGGENNERLEFLGDAILGFCIAEILYVRFPEVEEGDLSRLRASLVNRDTLAEVARELKLGEHLVLGSGELKSGGFRRQSILADALEALLGAIYRDGGFDVVRKLIVRLFSERVENLPDPGELKDPKTRLQEYLQGRGHSLPEYQVVEVAGAAHERRFRVSCRLSALGKTVEAEGSSRRKAEQAAAADMLKEVANE